MISRKKRTKEVFFFSPSIVVDCLSHFEGKIVHAKKEIEPRKGKKERKRKGKKEREREKERKAEREKKERERKE